jgi:hypothetical protein
MPTLANFIWVLQGIFYLQFTPGHHRVLYRDNEFPVGTADTHTETDWRAYLLVGGGHHVWEEAIESLVNPR